MFILSCALSFVLGCTLVLLRKWLHDIMIDVRYEQAIRNRSRRNLEAIRAIRNDDSLTPIEKYEESLRY